jgi:hypothetical protein
MTDKTKSEGQSKEKGVTQRKVTQRKSTKKDVRNRSAFAPQLPHLPALYRG